VPPPPLYVADTYLVEKNYTPERLAIVRLSGNDLPMDQCYINLALTEHHVKHADRSDDAKEVASLRSSPFSLDARLKVETPHKDFLVTLPTLFDRREIPDRGMLQHIQFQESTSNDVLYEVLAQHIKQTKSKDTLFLLDGLDEVSDMTMRRKQSVQHPGHAFLTGLLNKTNVIITTRPHTALPQSLP
jgi:hypothetical protein